MTCCWIGSEVLGEVIWYTSTIDVVVATVSTVVYKYNNTAITSFTTSVRDTVLDPLPTTINEDNTLGVPSDIIGSFAGPWARVTTLIYGNAFTDPYGTVYPSPTAVWMYADATYSTAYPIFTNEAWGCPKYPEYDGDPPRIDPIGSKFLF